MPICKYCRGEIEFRYVDGQRTPIHVNGGWCSGDNSSSSQNSRRPFESVVSYVNPDAHCPVCGETVYFYQSPSGGRVFFDDLGWPWPKHPCTDNPRAQTEKLERLKQKLHKTFRATSGESLRIFVLAELIDEADSILMKLCELDKPLVVLRLTVPRQVLNDSDITVKDLRAAPSFVVRFYNDYRLLEFISGRKRKIDAMRVPRGKC